MISDKEYVRAWESRVTDTTAHRHIDGERLIEKCLFECYKKGIGKTEIDDKIVVDFGCGGGFLGKFLFENFVLKKYIGIDISQKSIAAAQKNLENILEGRKEFICLSPSAAIEALKGFENADILCSFSVIQHFPSRDYLDAFLNALNESNIPDLCLQIRHFPETKFHDRPYETTGKIGTACYTNSEYMSKILSKYTLKSESKLEKSLYQYLTYGIKESTI